MKLIDYQILKTLVEEAKVSPRKRKNYNYHSGDEALLQRMLNALEPETYIRPHKHQNPDKTEVFLVLQGRFLVIEFDEIGNIKSHTILDYQQGIYGVEIAPGIYHTIISLQPESVAYEIKDGPYVVETDKKFAPWAPEEGTEEAINYLNFLKATLLFV